MRSGTSSGCTRADQPLSPSPSSPAGECGTPLGRRERGVLYLSSATWLHCAQTPSCCSLFPCRRVAKPFIKKNDPKNEALAKLGMMNQSPLPSVSPLLSAYFRSSAERACPSPSQQAGISLVLQKQPGDFWLSCEIAGSSHHGAAQPRLASSL